MLTADGCTKIGQQSLIHLVCAGGNRFEKTSLLHNGTELRFIKAVVGKSLENNLLSKLILVDDRLILCNLLCGVLDVGQKTCLPSSKTAILVEVDPGLMERTFIFRIYFAVRAARAMELSLV